MKARLILITDRRRAVLPLTEAVARSLDEVPAGSVAVLLREKDLSGAELLRLARNLRAVTSRLGAELIVSGRFDVALAAEADGVHLGGEAPHLDAVRAAVPFLPMGVSLHQDEVAPAGAAYALISPIFPTPSKPDAAPLGLAGLRHARARNPDVRLYALGGINEPGRVEACMAAGADGVAMLGAVLTSPDPGVRVRTLCAALSGAH